MEAKEMKIKFKTLKAGPNGITKPGEIIEVSEKEGKVFIQSGFAELISEDKEMEQKINEEEKNTEEEKNESLKIETKKDKPETKKQEKKKPKKKG
jgi:hypothetical protein